MPTTFWTERSKRFSICSKRREPLLLSRKKWSKIFFCIIKRCLLRSVNYSKMSRAWKIFFKWTSMFPGLNADISSVWPGRCIFLVNPERFNPHMLSKKSFTLIEMLLVTSLMAMIGLAVYHSLVNGMKIWDASTRYTAEEDVALFFDKISQDIRSATNYSLIK